ncbi:phage tail protein [Candidatus Contubernalis alkalaceticus]|uniref:phage tail protein n=1 Tax=Candidatus Contubernalis alkaliaceticus TaxID=338645 RepID=UPI001F4BF133|nr:phage tail protein [Candidatus Contubernalis alkalaceticus]UNC92704.1 phage tail protein [Candidatus Contubernalis alkalaceticus]
MSEAQDIIYAPKFPTTDELSFFIPLHLERGNINENFDYVQGDYLIKLITTGINNDIISTKFFIIVEANPDSSNNIQKKQVICLSREYELNKKCILEYEYPSRKLFSLVNELDTQGFPVGVMNYITTLTSWSLDVDSFSARPDLINKIRNIEVKETNIFEFLIEEIQTNFGCVFLFDTEQKKIILRSIEEIGVNRGLYLSEKNYIKAINKQINHDEIITRLYCFGKDNINFCNVNITGEPYIEDFSFYKTTEFMSQDLIDALNNYDVLLETEFEIFTTKKNELGIHLSTKDNLENDLVDKINELHEIQDDINDRIASNESYSDLNIDLAAKEIEVLTIQSEINHSTFEETQNTASGLEVKEMLQKHPEFDYEGISPIDNNINEKIIEILNVRNYLKKENHFTPEQLAELDYFVREEVWQDSSIENAEDLFNEGKIKLQKLSQPKIQFSIDSIDFLQILEKNLDKSKLILGDLINICFKKFGIDIKVRLVGYIHDYDNKKLTLEFSNKDSLDDPYNYFVDLQKNAIKTSKTVDVSKHQWDKSEENESLINNLINNNLNTATQKVLAGSNQDVQIDRQGIWLTKRLNEIIEPEQMRIINNMIVLSDDYFQTAKTAISPAGVNSQVVYGKMIVGEQGIFEGIDILDGEEVGINIGKYLDGEEDKYGIRIVGQNGVQTLLDRENNILIKDADNNYKFWVDAEGNICFRGVLIQSPSEDTFPLPVFRGNFSVSAEYFRGDVVTFNGSTWLYMNDDSSTGNHPAENVYWTTYASRGNDGNDGEDGNDGLDGNDGQDGQDGSPGDSVYVEFSIDGETNWHFPYVEGDLYMRTKIGISGSWTDAIRIVGEDGADGLDGQDGNDGADGEKGDTGPGLVFRGDFEESEIYVFTEHRRDVVRYNDTYYLFNVETDENGTTISSWVIAQWINFGATFSSVATKLLLAEDANILKTLVMGYDSASSRGIIRSAGKSDYGEGAGFWLGQHDAQKAKFDIGDENNYIRWDGEILNIKGLLESISGTFETMEAGEGFHKITIGKEHPVFGTPYILMKTDNYASYFDGIRWRFLWKAGTEDERVIGNFSPSYNEVTGAKTIALGASDCNMDFLGYANTGNVYHRTKRITGTCESNGEARFDHGITNGLNKILSVNVFVKVNSEEMIPMNPYSIGDDDIFASGGSNGLPFRAFLTYSEDEHNW